MSGHSGHRDEFLSQLLSSKANSNNNQCASSTGQLSSSDVSISKVQLIQELEAESDRSVSILNPSGIEEEPSLLEMMMAAHGEAKKISEIDTEKQVKEGIKTFGSGFKKGFFGGSNTIKDVKNKTNRDLGKSISSVKIDDKNQDTIPIICKNNTKDSSMTTLITEEVQKAIADDESPILKELKQGGKISKSSINYVIAFNRIRIFFDLLDQY